MLSTPDGPKKKAPRPFDMSTQPIRKIALRFCYDGGWYSGLAAQTSQWTPLPTVEQTLWDALCVARLVDPTKGMDDAGWSRCGRTDAGVSAAGQVVALWVRSRCVDERALREAHEAGTAAPAATVLSDTDELPYVATLNRLLPATIRVQAWSPVAPGFSSRFDCVYRHYKYFFTLGAPSTLAWQASARSHFPGRLDIARMREACARLVGEHDFRNLCKVDASKQITNFVRRIDGATIDRVSRGWDVDRRDDDAALPSDEPLYVLNLRGSAFLYHQVRNIMAVLFMVGAGLEEPSIIDTLVNVHDGAAAADRERTQAWLAAAAAADGAPETPDRVQCRALPPPPPDLAVVPTKPAYEMAADRPLMLWECGFRERDVQWRASTYAGALPAAAPLDEEPGVRASAHLHAQWTRDVIHTELVRHFCFATAPSAASAMPSQTSFADARTPCLPPPAQAPPPAARADLVPLGHGTMRPTTKYTALVRRPRDASVEEKNQKWREGKGHRRATRRAAQTGSDVSPRDDDARPDGVAPPPPAAPALASP